MSTPLAGRPDPRRREPLWDRVDRNRFRLVSYLIVFAAVCAALIALGLATAAGAVTALGFVADERHPLVVVAHWLLGGGFLRLWALGLVFALVYEVWALGRSERWLLNRLSAVIVPKGAELATKMALKDMAIAGGLPVAPALYLLGSSNVNAFVFKAPGRRPVLGVTEGLMSRLSVAEQRAVFANLVARVLSGDTMVSSAVTSLLAPLQWYRAHRVRALDVEDSIFRREAEQRREDPLQWQDTGLLPLAVAFLPLLIPVILAGEILAAAQRRSQLTAAEKADAEGMLLLKDPDGMISALERCVRLDNVVVDAGQSLGDLFYCWTGDSSDDDEDPEWRRMARLREVLGVWGWVPDADGVTSTAAVVDCAPPAPRSVHGQEP